MGKKLCFAVASPILTRQVQCSVVTITKQGEIARIIASPLAYRNHMMDLEQAPLRAPHALVIQVRTLTTKSQIDRMFSGCRYRPTT